jgi:hypothetical protein
VSLWNPINEPQDWVDFAGIRSPGLADIVGASTPRSWDERDSYAVAGAFLVYHGKRLSHFSVKLRLYTPEDWDGWWELAPILSVLPRRGTRAKAIDITHPILAAIGIRAVVVEDILQPEQTADGEWTIEIKLIEFRQPVIAAVKADAAKATPADPEDAQLAELNAESEANDQALASTP